MLSNLVGLWFGVKAPVNRAAYAATGFGLMALKYAVEAAVIYWFTLSILTPAQFLVPSVILRQELLNAVPEWVTWSLFAFSLPFLWIAITMSVRRAADARLSPWLGLLVLVPVFNLVFMPILSMLPSAEQPQWMPGSKLPQTEAMLKDASFALGLSLIFGAVMMLISVYVLKAYGMALFVGTPLLMGVVASFLFNRTLPRSYGASMLLGTAAIVTGGAGLLLFALEGVICIAMALPLMFPLGLLGGLLGKAIADSSRRPKHELVAALMVLPALAFVETKLVRNVEYVAASSIEIDAPPDVVWQNVLSFPELPPPEELHFRLGIACPQSARIVGTGVGAVRHREFSTGAFVEPITAWEPGKRLAFDVAEQPAPMFELTPYRHVHPPHLDGYLRSKRGEFRLIALPGNRTRLEGRTWYELEMFPQAYWTLWSDSLIHSIHLRVLKHVKRCAEETDVQDAASANSTSS